MKKLKIIFIFVTAAIVGLFIISVLPIQKSETVDKSPKTDKTSPQPLTRKIQFYEGPTVKGWGLDTNRDLRHYLSTPSPHIFPKDFCANHSLLLATVLSAPSNRKPRDLIRETWGQKSVLGQNSVSLYFLLGETLDVNIQNAVTKESEEFGDIIEERFLDSYNNLTLKTMFMVKLFINRCANNTRYLMKIDDDVLANIDVITNMLKERNDSNLLLGKIVKPYKPFQNPKSKWFAPRYLYSEKLYPPYLTGQTYLMSVDVAQRLYSAALDTPIFYLEDAYLTGICAKKANITPQHSDRFSHRISTDICDYMELYTNAVIQDLNRRRTLYMMMKDSVMKKECSKKKKRKP